MKASDLIALLRRSESETLDFKSKQYPFANAVDDAKSELLKDILSIANAWKDSDGYILIGVEEENGRAKRVCGADTSLHDSDVQQFVNSKTNRPVSFHLEVVPHDGMNLTVLQIDKIQARPIFLNKKFGQLRSNVVYIRRGSSTAEAAPDEIADMGRKENQLSKPNVSLEFEFVMERWQTGSSAVFNHVKPQWTEMDFLKVYAVNHNGGLAQYVQGSFSILSSILIDYMTAFTDSPESLAQAKQISFEISNKISARDRTASNMYVTPTPPEWKPLSPGMRLCLHTLKLAPHRKLLTVAPCSISWELAVDGCDLVKSETKFADIPLIDRRFKEPGAL